MAVSAGGVSLIAIGGLFVWSGLANAHPLDALHALVAGTPVQLGSGSNQGTALPGGTITSKPPLSIVNPDGSISVVPGTGYNPAPPGTSGTPALNGLNIGGF